VKRHQEEDVAEKQSETEFARNEVWTTSKAKDNYQNQCGFVAPFARVVIGVRGRAPWSGTNGGTPVGFSGSVASNSEPCDMTPKRRNDEAAEKGVVEDRSRRARNYYGVPATGGR
jgi:hypothetical protein